MTTIGQASEINVRTTLNNSFNTALAAFTLPSWLTLPTVYVYWSEDEPILPAYGIAHFGVDSEMRWQGNTDGTNTVLHDTALMEISAFASRSNVNWAAQLQTMGDIVRTWRADNPNVRIKDYAANQSSPANTNFLVRLEDLREVEVVDDPNPDVRRRRMLISYRWVYRA